MYQKVRAYIKERKLLEKNDKVIAGVSGGADSICLLFVLLELKREMGFELLAVHIHHGLRGEAADADERYVRDICKREGVECLCFHEDVGAYAKEHRLTCEEAGREVRRERFLQVFREQGATKIALAHHQNDNAETFLLNLCRGSALSGLRGILPKNGVWIHPLLCLTREEIESYLKKRELSYCTDETNLSDDYTRNRIRNHVIPYLEEEVNDRSVAHIARSMEMLENISSFVEREVERYAERCVRKSVSEEYVICKAELEKVPPELVSYIIYRALCRSAGGAKDIAAVHVEAVSELFSKQVGRTRNLPYGIVARRCYEGVSLSKDAGGCKEMRTSERTRISESAKMPEAVIRAQKIGEEEQIQRLFGVKILEKPAELKTFPQNNYTKWFDYDIIKNAVKIRRREPGDYIVIDKNGSRQKLKQYFINEKIPQNIRDSIWLVAEGHEILWIVGYRQSQRYQLSKNTKKILEIEYYGGEKDGRDN